MEIEKKDLGNLEFAVIIFLILFGDFESMKECLIYFLEGGKRIEQGEMDSKTKNVDVFNAFEKTYNLPKTPKKVLYDVLELSKNTFNKNFKDYLDENNLSGRRLFTAKRFLV